MAARTSLVTRVSNELRGDLASGIYPVGGRLPSESALCSRFGVSRPTLRTALRELEALGLVRTQHGVGTFVNEPRTVRVGLERLDSMTESIRAMGRSPEMVYASRQRRQVLPDEAERMAVPADSEVLELRRTILADGEVVAYSYDLLPIEVFGPDVDAVALDAIEGSIFAYFREQLGVVADHSLAEVHAVASEHIGWGAEAAAHSLFVLLNQLHYDASGRLLMYSRTYFIEGRYAFTIHRSSGPVAVDAGVEALAVSPRLV